MFIEHQQFEKKKKQKRVWVRTFVIGFILIFIGSLGMYTWRQFVSPVLLLEKKISSGDHAPSLLKLVPNLLGFSEPRTYLLLFANNTEIRPAGGFLGSYATVRVENGDVETLVVEGSESLDKRTPDDWRPEPPGPIKQYLGVDRWYFRDSNWHPDFQRSTEKTLEFYKAEGGVAADEIDAVISVTPTVLERILGEIGPVTVQGITFNEMNVVEVLEHDVEYGFEDRDISFADRKQILKPLMETILRKAKFDMFTRYDEYLQLFQDLANEKHILIAGIDPELKKTADAFGWHGRVEKNEGDFLFWVDANLAALKTDHAMDRDLEYELTENEDGSFTAKATMHYQHNGTFDWRTTRYLSYVRLFVPKDATFEKVTGAGRENITKRANQIDQGIDGELAWFGVYIGIEPGRSRGVTFTYTLPREAVLNEDGDYLLRVQKQAGTLAPGLTLSLDFDKTIRTINVVDPTISPDGTGLSITTDLLRDRDLQLLFE